MFDKNWRLDGFCPHDPESQSPEVPKPLQQVQVCCHTGLVFVEV